MFHNSFIQALTIWL